MFPVTKLTLRFNFYLSTSVKARVPSDKLLLKCFSWEWNNHFHTEVHFTQRTGSWSLGKIIKHLSIFDCKASLKAAFK